MSTTTLDFTADSRVAQREIDKLVLGQAKLREQNRLLAEQTKRGARESADAVRSFSEKLTEAAAKTNSWADGMRRLREQASLAKSDFGVMLSAMGKPVLTKEPFTPWVTGLKNLHQQNDKWSQGMKRLQEQSASLRQPFVKMFSDAASGAAGVAATFSGMTGGLLAVGGAVAIVRQAYTAWRQEMQQTGEAHKQFTTSLVSQLVKTGNVAQGKQVEQLVGSVPGVTREQALASLTGIQEASPLSGLQRQGAMMQAAARLSPAMPSAGEQFQFGGLVGQLGEIMPTASADDLTDVAAKLQARAGGNISRLGGEKFQRAMKQLQAAGYTQGQALGTALAATDANISPEFVSKLAEVSAASKESLMPGRGERGPAASAKRKLAQTPGKDRVALMRSDKLIAEAGLGADALELGRLSPELVRQGEWDIIKAQQQDYAKSLVSDLGGFGAGRRAKFTQRAAVESDITEGNIGGRQEQLNAFRQIVEARAKERGGLTGWQTGVSLSAMGGDEQGVRNIAVSGGLMSAKEADAIVKEIQTLNGNLSELNRNRAVNVDGHNE